MDDKRQEFVTNGFLGLEWTDEIVAWDPAAYNNIYMIHINPKDIWRPRMILLNTLDARDLFDDDYSPTFIVFDGSVSWFPGSLFPASCKLNLEKFPFDRQNCSLSMLAMGWFNTELNFYTDSGGVELDNFVVNGEWEIISTNLTVQFILQRRSGFFILNIVMPVVLLSFLNIIVFLIPVDSGEKISYGITVLLALAVFMSIVSDMLPRSSDVVPLVTIYLFVLLIISVLTVLVAIIIVWLHHKDEKESKRQKVSTSYKNLFKKVRLLNRATAPLTTVSVNPATGHQDQDLDNDDQSTSISKGPSLLSAVKKLSNPDKVFPPVPEEGHRINRYRLIGRYLDSIAFIVFIFLWGAVTLGFTLALSTE
ncbi:neuronal acetylcholine receptor subunit alpha-3 [Plakobranchus ocellatus]|uniref:Neuronal acetylcholine receptor subunit alpha-3 n=1 Tax=Plakobranchus ocellatus TaxID=259542 RepID=A0AAV4BBZ7_9GAST|nr:neuronal acetylcholine receptor subunit alpha-3 [Plakobranchus ocellatus]